MLFWKYIASYQVLLTISGHCLKKKPIAEVCLFSSEHLTVFFTLHLEKEIYSWNSQLWHTAIPLFNSSWWRHADSVIAAFFFSQWETSAHAVIPSLMGGLTMTLCNRINVISSRSECFWRHFDSSRWGSSLPCVSSTRLSQGVSHSAVTELRGFRAAGSRWAWRGCSHPEMTDCFTGTKLC